MRIEPLEPGECDCSRTEAAQALRRQLLNGHGAHEVTYRETARVPRSTEGGQDMVGSRTIVPEGFRRPRTQEHRSCALHMREPVFGVANVEHEMLGGVTICDLECGVELWHHDRTARLH